MRNSTSKQVLKTFIEKSYQIIKQESNDNNCDIYLLKRNNKEFQVSFYIRNIVPAYLSYDPSIERIIIPVIEEISRTTNSSAFLLAGYKRINDKDIIMFWDPMRYVHHKTNRSVYIYPSNIEKAYQNGYYSCKDHNNMIYGCDEDNFNKVLENYIEDTYMGD